MYHVNPTVKWLISTNLVKELGQWGLNLFLMDSGWNPNKSQQSLICANLHTPRSLKFFIYDCCFWLCYSSANILPSSSQALSCLGVPHMLGWKLLWSTLDLLKWVVLSSQQSLEFQASSRLYHGFLEIWTAPNFDPGSKDLLRSLIGSLAECFFERSPARHCKPQHSARRDFTFQVMQALWRSWDRPQGQMRNNWVVDFFETLWSSPSNPWNASTGPKTTDTRFPWSNSPGLG